ncbi:MAG: hypothetical protein WA964_19625 [Ilumatobacter sp.]|uniref:hypothetical protein n=1 Tax=Ilumatobacter sp. TaxID=1967498 RepID=UPI003C795706
MSDFDDAGKIRELFDRAMTDAPAPPTLTDIEHGTSGVVSDGPRRWTLTAAVASAAVVAAAAIGLVAVLPDSDSDTLRTSESGDAAVVVPATTAGDTTRDAVTTTIAELTDTSIEPSAVEGPSVIVSSVDGVAVAPFGGEFADVIEGPTSSAHGVSDGRIFALVPASSQNSGSSSIVSWDPATGEVSTVEVPDTTGGPLFLRDIATIDGAVTMLYEIGPVVCDVVEDECESVLWTFEPDTGRSERLVTLNNARARWVTLSLSDTGLVVGESTGENGTNFYSGLSGAAIELVPPTPAELGLSTGLVDCTNCPRAYTIDNEGRHIAWREGPDLIVVDLDDPARRVVTRSVVPDLGSDDLTLSIDGIALDGDTVSEGFAAFNSSDGATSFVVDLGDATEFGPFAGSSTLA